MKISGTKKLQAVCVIASVAALCALALAPLTSAQAPKRLVTQAVDDHQLATLKGNVHPLARAEFDRGIVSDSEQMSRMLLLLKRSDDQEAALAQLMEEQQASGSSNFHKWLSPAEFGQKFGPSDEDVQTVTSWLAAQGFQSVKVGAGRTVVEFSGTVGQVRNAFHTEIHRYMVHGEEHTANASELQIPAALTPVVKGVASLHNFRKTSFYHRAGLFRREKATGRITPLTTIGTSTFGVGPTDFATIYNVTPLWTAGIDGTGQTIAIVGRTNINAQDVTDFRALFGLPANAPQIILNGPDPGIVSPDEEGEADLDVQWSGAVAKGAQIKFVVSESTLSSDGVDLSAFFIVDNNLAPVMSESFGSCEAGQGTAGNAFLNSLWQQAAAQGITVMVSSGDNGSAGCDPNPNSADQNEATLGLAVSGTASTPFNVAVGGTDFDQVGNTSTFWNPTNASTTQASAKSYIHEETWNDSCASAGSLSGCTTVSTRGVDIVAASGGPSSIYAKPVWQSTGTHRTIPDVSLFASNGNNGSFYITCQKDTNTDGQSCNLNSPFQDFTGVGGTSASSPAFAGIMALVVQKTGSRQGNANYILYKLAAQSGAICDSSSSTLNLTSNTCIFYDITKGNISVACLGGTANCSATSSTAHGIIVDSSNKAAWTTTAGYDAATGLGSVNAANLVNGWAATTFTGSNTTITTLTPTNPAHGGSVNVSIRVAPNTGTAVPTGIVALTKSNSGTSLGSFTLSAGIASGTTTLLPGGSYSIVAHYPGDATFSASTSPAVPVTVGQETSKTVPSFVTFDSQNSPTCHSSGQSVPYGSNYILRVDINNSGALCADIDPTVKSVPTGTVTMTDKGASLDGGTFTLNSAGFFEDQPIQLDAGSHSVNASYSGDSSYQASSSTGFAITITQAATATAVVGSPSTITSGGSVTLTATVSSNSNADKSHAPSGTVQFMNGSTNLGAPVTCTQVAATSSAGASCTATLTTTLTALAPPISFDNRWRRTPYELLAALFAMLAVTFFIRTRRLRGPRRAYAYAAVGAFLIASAALAGCSGASSGGGGGGGKTITAKYSGDTNYTASQGSGTVTVQ